MQSLSLLFSYNQGMQTRPADHTASGDAATTAQFLTFDVAHFFNDTSSYARTMEVDGEEGEVHPPAPPPPAMDDDTDSFGSAASRHADDDDQQQPHHRQQESDDEEEEEEECRVCRGPAEGGRPLFSPCKCSGSIGLCHQDCLTSWLEVTHGGGRCELCSYKFRFRPLYAPDAPSKLPPYEVLLGLSRRALVKFLPFVLRIVLSLVAWLVVLPLCTAYLYHAWMHSPKTLVGRITDRDLIVLDGVAGAVVAAFVVISFLSLMSLADFIRFQWRPNPEDGDGENNENGEGGAAAAADGGQDEGDDDEAAQEEGGNGDDEEVDAENERGAAMPAPFEVAARGGIPVAAAAELPRPPRRHGHDHQHRRNQRQRHPQNNLPPIDQGVDDGFLENDDVHNRNAEEEEKARRQMERIRDRIEERRRRNRTVLERRRPPSETDSEEDRADVDDESGEIDIPPASAMPWLGKQQQQNEPLGGGLDTADPSAGMPQLHRNAVGIMDGGEPFFSYQRLRRERSDDDDDDIRRRRRLIAEAALERREGSQNSDGEEQEPSQRVEDEVVDGPLELSPLHEREVAGVFINDPLGLAIGRDKDDMPGESSDQYDSDDTSLPSPSTEPPSPSPKPLDLEPDEAALENMMRAQEEAMLDLDSDGENDGGDLQMPGVGHPAQQGEQPNEGAAAGGAQAEDVGARQQGGGMFEPQFEPLDPGFDQDEADVEFQVALDELLGFRGPMGALIRNLLWLLAFITTYLGLFAFVPYRFGSTASRSRAFAFLTSLIQRPLRHVHGGGLFQGLIKDTTNGTTNTSSVANETVLTLTAALVSNNTTAAINGSTTVLPVIESAATSFASNTTTTAMMNGSATIVSAADASIYLIRELNAESQRLNTLLRLPDVAKLVLGYFVIATIVFLWHTFVTLYIKLRKNDNNARADENADADARIHALRRHVEQMHDHGHDFDGMNDDEDEEGDPAALQQQLQQGEVIEIKLTVVMDCAVAVMKVCILLFIKMLVLPLVLGISLDLVTLEVLNTSVHARVHHAGADLFGSLLLHWVAGITFMLLVTVSVLQLREVIHPDLLARIIRPQEPQPDLLGNLLKEGGFTHAKRMMLSLAIYIALLLIHIWLPSKLLIISGISRYIPVFRPKFWRIVLSQLQVPLELLVFHLSMLAFLEKYKNYISQLQHKWLVFVCDRMGLTDYLLPRDVGAFSFVGCKPLFRISDQGSEGSGESVPILDEATIMTEATSSSSVYTRNHEGLPIKSSRRQPKSPTGQKELDPFWTELISMDKKNIPIDEFLVAHLNTEDTTTMSNIIPPSEAGVTDSAGKRVLDASKARIRLPSRPEDTPFYEDDIMMKTESNFLPTSIGAYRFRLRLSTEKQVSSHEAIEIWKENPGNLTPRPPEGWDDLGVGGAEVQGRWAWEKEKKSKIEQGVAQRSVFFEQPGTGGNRLASSLTRYSKGLLLVLKVMILVVLSWVAMSLFICGGITAPLVTGRFVYFLLQIPDRFVHDPLAYTIGGAIVFPAIFRIGQGFNREEGGIGRCLWNWACSLRLPPRRTPKLRIVLQALVLWFAIIPLFVGLIYQLFFIKGSSFWLHKESPLDLRSLALAWGAGSMWVNAWAALCYVGAFKLDFWLKLLLAGDEGDAAAAAPAAAAPVAPNNANNNADADEAGADPAAQQDDNAGRNASPVPVHACGRIPWQGEDGRIARFGSSMYAVLGKSEWDKVDRDILLGQSLVPIIQQLSMALAGPLLAYFGWATLLSILTRGRGRAGIILPFVGLVEKGIYRRFFYRCFVLTTISIQLASVFQSSIQCWFRAAHKAARDDRYLIGEVLMNYARQPSN